MGVLAYKGCNPGMKGHGGYQFKMGLNMTGDAKQRSCGFHCAENPLDCLLYFSNLDRSEYYLVYADGEIHSDDNGTALCCTEMEFLRRLSKREFIAHAMRYIIRNPGMPRPGSIASDKGAVGCAGYVIVIGERPVAKGGRVGDILGFLVRSQNGGFLGFRTIELDGENFLPGIWYGSDGKEVGRRGKNDKRAD